MPLSPEIAALIKSARKTQKEKYGAEPKPQAIAPYRYKRLLWALQDIPSDMSPELWLRNILAAELNIYPEPLAKEFHSDVIEEDGDEFHSAFLERLMSYEHPKGN